jgi:hypothetical protein
MRQSFVDRLATPRCLGSKGLRFRQPHAPSALFPDLCFSGPGRGSSTGDWGTGGDRRNVPNVAPSARLLKSEGSLCGIGLLPARMSAFSWRRRAAQNSFQGIHKSGSAQGVAGARVRRSAGTSPHPEAPHSKPSIWAVSLGTPLIRIPGKRTAELT